MLTVGWLCQILKVHAVEKMTRLSVWVLCRLDTQPTVSKSDGYYSCLKPF